MLRDDRYSRARAEMISADSSFRIQGEIPSGPGALVVSRSRRSFLTPASVTVMAQHLRLPVLVLRFSTDFKLCSGAGDILAECRLEPAVQCFCSALSIGYPFAVHGEGRNAGCLGLCGLDIGPTLPIDTWVA